MADDSKDEHFDDSDFSLINTPEDEAEDVSMNSAGNNNEASASVSGAAALFGASLSSQAVEDTERPKSSVVVSDPMTQSQFAQVDTFEFALLMMKFQMVHNSSSVLPQRSFSTT